MTVRTLLEKKPRDIVTTTPETTIDEAMDLLIKHKISCLPVMDADNQLAGIISDKDIFHKVHETNGDYHNVKVGELMTTDLIVGVPEDEISYIAGVMDQNWVRHIPIVEGEKMIGLISQGDVIRTQSRNRRIENRYLRMYLDGIHTRDMSGD